MIKITTLFKKNPENLGRVINEINPENKWALTEGKATRKFDGTAVAIINGYLYKRYDVKKGKQVPVGAIPCQDPDEITGHWPHWVRCETDKPEDKYFFEAFNSYTHSDGTFELCGPKINGNKEKLDKHKLIRHGEVICAGVDRTWEGIKEYLEANDIEGIIFHNPDGRMCKIRKSDFGIKRNSP